MNYVKWELRSFFNNRKNIIIFSILLIASLYYALYLAPAYEPIESVNEDEIKVRYEDRKEFLDNGDIEKSTHPYTIFALLVFPKWNEYDGERLSALASDDLHAYAQATHEWYLYSVETIKSDPFDVLRYNPRYYTFGNIYAKQDGLYNYLYSAERYRQYASAEYELSIQIFEERTALQTLKRLLESSLPYILLISCLLLSNDIVMKDRKHPSIVNGFPMTPFKRLMMKGIVAFTGSLTSIAVLIPAFLIIGFRDGFGTMKLPAVIYNYAFLNNGTYESASMGIVLLKNFGMLFLWFILIISLVLFLSILFKNEYVNLIIGIILFIEVTYYQRGKVIEDWLSYLPTSCVQFGDVITGYRNYEIVTDSLSVELGFVVLLSSITLIIMLIWIFTKMKKMLI